MFGNLEDVNLSFKFDRKSSTIDYTKEGRKGNWKRKKSAKKLSKSSSSTAD